MTEALGSTYEIKVINKLSALEQIEQSLIELQQNWDLSTKLVHQLNLCIEELLVNVIFNGYDDNNEHFIIIEFNNKQKSIAIVFVDDGKPFNLLENELKIDLHASIEDREVGGLGIHLVKTLMDDISYQRANEKNIITLTKNL